MGRPANDLRKLLIICAVIIVLGIVFWPNFSRLYELIKRDRFYQQEIDRLSEENDQLREKIYLLENDPVYLEKIARDELGLSKPDETIYKFQTSSTTQSE